MRNPRECLLDKILAETVTMVRSKKRKVVDVEVTQPLIPKTKETGHQREGDEHSVDVDTDDDKIREMYSKIKSFQRKQMKTELTRWPRPASGRPDRDEKSLLP